MGNLNVTPAMITASPEVREACAKGVVSAKDTVAKHVQSIKEVAGSETAQAIALGAAVGAVSPIPGGALLGGVAGAAAEGVKKAIEEDKQAVKTATIVGLCAGPLTGLAAYAFCSGKAQSAYDKMMKFVKEHPDMLLAQAN